MKLRLKRAAQTRLDFYAIWMVAVTTGLGIMGVLSGGWVKGEKKKLESPTCDVALLNLIMPNLID